MSLVRSTLEYASCLWSPYSVKHRGFPENTLRRATKFILNYPLRELAYKDKLEQLDLRRDIHDVVLLFKFKFGDVTELSIDFGSRNISIHYSKYYAANFRLLSFHNQDYFTKSYF